jgi:hypothetical protein
MDPQEIQSYQDKMEKILQGQKKRMICLSYTDAVRTLMPLPTARKPPDDQMSAMLKVFKDQSSEPRKKQPEVFDGTSDEKTFV